jgi:HD-GYP domain-containing protein (c-di-GMP phosphodiesterase class II)
VGSSATIRRQRPECVDPQDVLLARFVDLEQVASLLQSFSDSAGIASAIIDPQGTVLTQANWQPVCMEFHRRHPETLARCVESDTVVAAHARDGKQAAIHQCLNGLTDAAAPIVVDGCHLATAFVGQFFLSEPDLECFTRQATRWGFDRDAYLAAVAQVPVLTEARVRAALDFLASSTQMLVRLGRDGLEKDRAEQRLRRTLARQSRSVDAAVGALALTVEMRDPYTAGHQERVSRLAVAIGKQMRLPSKRMTSLRIAALVHDLGKISIPAEILSKPGALSDGEWQLLRQHPDTAYAILHEMKFPGPVARIIRDHHERLDGSGYPRGLKNDEIRIESRILAVADVVEAMSSHRPYRPALGIDAALAEIGGQRGVKYDPSVVDACVRLFRVQGFTFDGDPDSAAGSRIAIVRAAGR